MAIFNLVILLSNRHLFVRCHIFHQHPHFSGGKQRQIAQDGSSEVSGCGVLPGISPVPPWASGGSGGRTTAAAASTQAALPDEQEFSPLRILPASLPAQPLSPREENWTLVMARPRESWEKGTSSLSLEPTQILTVSSYFLKNKNGFYFEF